MAGGGSAAALFRLENIGKEASGRAILKDIHLEIPAGRTTVLLGPSGAGKTSLLRLLDRLAEPDAGRILFHGRPLDAYDVGELRRRVGFVFQTPVVFPGTVRENLREAAEISGLEPSAFDAAAERALRRAELDARLLGRDSERLSVGEQQRLTLARVLVTRPEVLLLDEPTSALDPPTATRLLRTVRRLVNEEGLTAVLASHRISEARQVADRAVMIVEGEIIEEGPAKQVLQEPRREETRRFLRAADGPQLADHDSLRPPGARPEAERG